MQNTNEGKQMRFRSVKWRQRMYRLWRGSRLLTRIAQAKQRVSKMLFLYLFFKYQLLILNFVFRSAFLFTWWAKNLLFVVVLYCHFCHWRI